MKFQKFSIVMPVLCAVFLALTGAPAAQAQTPPVANAAGTDVMPVDACAPTAAELQQVAAIQNDPTLTSSAELTQELAVRKQLLKETITCAENQAQALQNSLDAVTASGGAIQVQSELASKLNDAMNFYTIELAKVGGVGISGSQAIAKEVLAWRMGSYEPLAADVNDFILWSDNQDLFNTAQTRMNETSQAVSFLENAAPNSDLQNAFAAARASFNNAMGQNQAAESALAQFQPAEQSLSLIQQSLSSLSDTYQQFFNVSGVIKTLLPQ